MEQIGTISLTVDEVSKEKIERQKESNVFLLRYGTPVEQDIGEVKTNIADNDKMTRLVEHRRQGETLNGCFDNPGFYERSKFSMTGSSFGDVVEEVIKEHLRNDVHPFGRSSVYRKIIGVGERTSVYQDDSALFVWALATIIILVVAVGVIVMSLMHQAEYHDHMDLKTNSNITTTPSYTTFLK